MTFHYRYRKQILLGIVVTLIVATVVGFGIYKFEGKKEKKTVSSITKKEEKKESNEEEPEIKEEYMVDIKGEVITPGIYMATKEDRVIDIVEKAGGLTEYADTSVINLSKKIKDEMVIIIYSKEEVRNWIYTKEQEKYLQEKCQGEKDQVQNDACIEEETEDQEQTSTPSIININTATKEELMTLTGIGETKADAIISYREKTPFETIEDIKNVSGIGDSTFEQIKDSITVE